MKPEEIQVGVIFKDKKFKDKFKIEAIRDDDIRILYIDTNTIYNYSLRDIKHTLINFYEVEDDTIIFLNILSD